MGQLASKMIIFLTGILHFISYLTSINYEKQ